MSNGRLLIVDDEPSVLAAYAHSLAGAGFDVARAASGADALRRIEHGRFDAILSDVSMPGMDGFTLLRRLRLRSPEAPVILMFDEPDDGAAVKGARLGAFQSLVKPVAARLLARSASRAVSLGRSRRQVPLTPRQPGERPETTSVSASDAKNEFGLILEKAIQGGTVTITKHGAPKAVLMSVEQFDALTGAHGAELDTLSGEFDRLLSGMQTRAARAGMQAAFDASPKQLGKAAAAAARKRG